VQKQILRLVLLFGLLTLLPACSSASKQSASTHLQVQLTEHVFQPSQFTVPAGADITLDADNIGAIEHTFVILNLGTQATPPFDADDEANIYWQTAISPGSSTSTSFTAPAEPGEYQVVCRTPGHLEAGMIGKMTVIKP
jgi:uncharacterized cupredoxin-like copper-binding protein